MCQILLFKGCCKIDAGLKLRQDRRGLARETVFGRRCFIERHLAVNHLFALRLKHELILILSMNPNSQLTIFCMVGAMGSGKTTLALKIAKEKGALFQSLDGTIKNFNEPIGSLEGYEKLMPKALDLMYARALEALKKGQSVTFDIARWPWLKDLANEADAKIEIYYFNISPEERWRRVEKRNREKPEHIYHWTMTREEFDAQDFHRKVPPAEPGLTIININE